MNENSHIVVFITANKLQAGRVLLFPQMTIVDAVESEWNQSTIGDLLVQIKEKYNTSQIRIVFGEDISFVGSIAVQKGKDKDRAYIEQAAKTIFPYLLEHSRWDYKDVFIRKDMVVLQIASLLQEPVSFVVTGASKAGISIQAMEPASYAIARISENLKEPHISIFRGDAVLAVASYRGLVLGTSILRDIRDYAGLRLLVRTVYEHYGLVIKTALCSHDDIVLALRQGSSLEITRSKLHPMLGMAKKKDIKGADNEVMNIATQGSETKDIKTNSEDDKQQNNEIKIIKHEEIEKHSTQIDENLNLLQSRKKVLIPKPSKKIRLVIGLGVLFFVAVFVFLILLGAIIKGKNQSNSSQLPIPTSQIIPTSNIIPTQAEPVAITPAIYKVQILNGTGIKGEALHVEALMEKLGFTTFGTGNADVYTYTNTEVKIKEGLPDALFEVVKQAIGGEYTTLRSKDVLTSNYAYDIQIISGKKK
jgi:hypothetical protein